MSITTPSAPLPSAAVPVTSVPMKLPATTLPVVPGAGDLDAVAGVARDHVARRRPSCRRSCCPDAAGSITIPLPFGVGGPCRSHRCRSGSPATTVSVSGLLMLVIWIPSLRIAGDDVLVLRARPADLRIGVTRGRIDSQRRMPFCVGRRGAAAGERDGADQVADNRGRLRVIAEIRNADAVRVAGDDIAGAGAGRRSQAADRVPAGFGRGFRKPFPSATVPVLSVPIRFPSTRLPVEPESKIWIPLTSLPEMRFPRRLTCPRSFHLWNSPIAIPLPADAWNCRWRRCRWDRCRRSFLR